MSTDPRLVAERAGLAGLVLGVPAFVALTVLAFGRGATLSGTMFALLALLCADALRRRLRDRRGGGPGARYRGSGDQLP